MGSDLNGGETMCATFDADVTVDPGRTVVCVTGDLDMDNCPHLALRNPGRRDGPGRREAGGPGNGET